MDDEQRNRYGVLLDRAAERGLLTPGEYEVRLGELASATTVERMQQLVTELPILTAPPPVTKMRSRTTPRTAPRAAPSEAALLATPGARKRASPWFGMVLVVVALLVALVFFAFYAEHLAHTHRTGAPAPHGVATAAAPQPRSATWPLSGPRS